jgi:hypothetical protein
MPTAFPDLFVEAMHILRLHDVPAFLKLRCHEFEIGGQFSAPA